MNIVKTYHINKFLFPCATTVYTFILIVHCVYIVYSIFCKDTRGQVPGEAGRVSEEGDPPLSQLRLPRNQAPPHTVCPGSSDPT